MAGAGVAGRGGSAELAQHDLRPGSPSIVPVPERHGPLSRLEPPIWARAIRRIAKRGFAVKAGLLAPPLRAQHPLPSPATLIASLEGVPEKVVCEFEPIPTEGHRFLGRSLGGKRGWRTCIALPLIYRRGCSALLAAFGLRLFGRRALSLSSSC